MFLNVEGPLLHPWKAYVLFERSENSWQGVKELGSEGDFFLTEEHRWTGHTGFFSLTELRRLPEYAGFFFLTDLHRWTERTAFHRGLAAGRYHRTLQPSLAETLCDLCMPKAFCGLETVRKNALLTLCALWEIIYPQGLSSVLKRSVNSVCSVRDNIPTENKQCAKTLC